MLWLQINCHHLLEQLIHIVDHLHSLNLLSKFLNYLSFFSISGYAATSKSTTILNFCGIDKKLIDCIYDTTPDKIGKFSPGMHIPIINYDEFKNNYQRRIGKAIKTITRRFL